MPPDEATDLASHFEDVLDREDGTAPEPAQRAPREEEPEQLFPEREVEGEADEGDYDPDELEAQDAPDEDEPEPEKEKPEETSLDLNKVVRVNVDGQPAEVSLQEALNGYVRAETFHRRLNQLGQVAQEIEKERGELVKGRQYYADMIPALMQQLYSLQPQEPDWDKLYAENPTEASLLERQWRSYREKVQQLAQEHERVTAEQKREQERQIKIFEDTQRRQLAQWVPEWSDNKRWDRDRKSMIRTAQAVGYSEAELSQLRDARPTMVLLWASRYLELMRNKPKPVRGQQGALRPGAISSRAAPNGLARAEKRLQRSGSVRDAARAFEEDLNREG